MLALLDSEENDSVSFPEGTHIPQRSDDPLKLGSSASAHRVLCVLLGAEKESPHQQLRAGALPLGQHN